MLVREVLPGIEDHRYGNSRVAYTIVMGDYNFNLDRPWNRYPMSPLLSPTDEHIVISDGKWVKEIRTAQEGMLPGGADRRTAGGRIVVACTL